MKDCCKCKKKKKLTEYSFKNKKLGILSSYCKNCSRALIKTHYVNNKDYYIQKAKRRNDVIIKNLRAYIYKYLQNHACLDCQERDIVVLEFDHLRDKKFDISKAISNKMSLKTLINEISKCDVVCANCHRRRTAKRGGWAKILPL